MVNDGKRDTNLLEWMVLVASEAHDWDRTARRRPCEEKEELWPNYKRHSFDQSRINTRNVSDQSRDRLLLTCRPPADRPELSSRGIHPS
ncbi:jg23163 [Pararge aegeria aegeria]|uniref:Jg23163 protein n=1 Tax=Pararge aegeria aegeria TaxID=348720 RepID=A0A8S4QT20_9NEOP|nr:jg23163 [Pararge aegeria aegeria]